MRELTRAERLKVLNEIDDLLRRDRAGEDVDYELQLRGQLLLYRERDGKPPKKPPIHKKSEYQRYEQIAASRNIPSSAFQNRVRSGWDYELASTRPYVPRPNSIPDEHRRIMRAAGVSVNLYRWRVANDWDPDKAAYCPPDNKKSKRGKD